MKKDWTYKKFEDCIENVKYTTKIQSKDYMASGEYPIISQEEELVSGYWNKNEDVFSAPRPLVVFGDHTRVLKYIDFDFVLGADGVKILLPIEDLEAKFLYYFLKWYNVPNLGYSRHYKLLKEISIPIPPLSIQRSIVAELDLLHSVISKKKEQLRELDNLAQSLFYQMFGDPITNPMGWEIKKLGEVVAEDCSLSYGIVQPGDHVENGIPVVRPIDLIDTYVFRKGLKCTSKEIANAYKRTVLRGNELLMCVRGTTGVVSIASSELVGCNTTRGITPIALGEKVSLWFVYHLLKMSSYQQLIASLTYGIALKQINMKDVRTLPIILPPLSLQQSFAAKVSAIEAQKQAITQSIQHTEALLAQRIDQYFA